MEQLHYADEVRPTTEVPIPQGEVKPQELTLAKQLIEQTANETFEPQKYKDTVRERVMETIQRKIDGQDITAPTSRPTAAARSSTSWRRSRRASPRTAEGRREGAQGRREAARRNERLRLQGVEGRVLSADLTDDEMLAFYASKFPTVEINNTFYRLPKENVLQEWASQVPEEFTFAIKASQRITHSCAAQARVRGAPWSSCSRTPRCSATARPDPLSASAESEEGRRSAARLPGHAAERAADTRSSSGTRAGSTTTSSASCAIATSRCASPSRTSSSRPVQSRRRRGAISRLHRLDYDDAALAEWAKCVAAQQWSEAYVYFKHDEGDGSGPPAVDAFMRACSHS